MKISLENFKGCGGVGMANGGCIAGLGKGCVTGLEKFFIYLSARCLPFWGCFAARVGLTSGLLPALHSLDIHKGLTRGISPGMIFGDRFFKSFGVVEICSYIVCGATPRIWIRVGFLFQDITENMLKEFGILLWDHLKSNGFWERYTCWIYHGETSSRPHDHGQFYETGSTSNDPTTAFINDMFPHDSGVCPERQHIPQAPMQAVPRGVNTAGIAKYNRLIAFQQTALCPGHEKTVLQCVMEVMHIKVDTKSTVMAVDRYLQYAASLLPDGHRHPTTHHKVRRILRDLGLSYIKIHACRYDCVLFWGKDADGNDLEGLHRCPVCGTDRYKRTPAGNRKPVKVLRYFPLRDRLERLYMSSKTAGAVVHVFKDGRQHMASNLYLKRETADE
ncbi:hypothetical protein ACLB2K_016344 [Fragaria x ananassa]